MDFSFLKDRYDWELDRKDKLTSSLTLPVGIMTALGGLMAVMARSFSFRDTTLSGLFLLLLIVDTVTFLCALVFLAQGYHGQKYGYLPRLGELREGEHMLMGFFEGAGLDESLARTEFARQLEDRIIEAADRNARSNDRRTAFLHRASIALFLILFFTALTGIVYVVDQAK